MKLGASVDDAIVNALRSGMATCDLTGELDQTIYDRVREIAARLGLPYGGRRGAKIETLSPQRKSDAAKTSLSRSYGMGRFPWHTDAAHRLMPARWVVMACIEPGAAQACTELLPWSRVTLPEDMAEACLTRPFAFVSGRDSFLATIAQAKRGFIRFDPGCMRPLERQGVELLSTLAEWMPAQSASLRIEWRPGRAVIFDNWSCLHRRHDAAESAGRKLLRAYAI